MVLLILTTESLVKIIQRTEKCIFTYTDWLLNNTDSTNLRRFIQELIKHTPHTTCANSLKRFDKRLWRFRGKMRSCGKRFDVRLPNFEEFDGPRCTLLGNNILNYPLGVRGRNTRLDPSQ